MLISVLYNSTHTFSYEFLFILTYTLPFTHSHNSSLTNESWEILVAKIKFWSSNSNLDLPNQKESKKGWKQKKTVEFFQCCSCLLLIWKWCSAIFLGFKLFFIWYWDCFCYSSFLSFIFSVQPLSRHISAIFLHFR